MKTSRSCQRRINFLCKNESVMTKLKVIVGEMKFDEDIYQKFGVSEYLNSYLNFVIVDDPIRVLQSDF